MKTLTPVIGMEIHVELRTKSKMFCGCPADHFNVEPNTHTCPVCLGLPGALPVPNAKAIEWTILIGLALNCEIAKISKFDRKHYFYPDLPKGYQISQYDEPLCLEGKLNTSYGDIGITRVHLEEDTAKLQHQLVDGQKVTLVDFNRSGVALVEIVTDPDITSAKQAKEYAQKIQTIIRYLGVSDADMEKGSLRVEANISWGLDLGYKVEVKNINSFRFLERAIDFELNRQKALLDQGQTPSQETRGWSEAKNATVSQRSKEDAKDYRYFPEPDIPPLVITPDQVARLRDDLPVLPDALKDSFINEWHLRVDYAETLIQDKTKALAAIACFKLGQTEGIDASKIANQIINKHIDPYDPSLVIKQLKTSESRSDIGQTELNSIIQTVIIANPDIVTKYKTGKTAVIGVLIGEVMKQTHGQANPKAIHQLLISSLSTNHQSPGTNH